MELNVENVYRLLDSTEYTMEYLTENKIGPDVKKFNLQDWTDTVKLLLDSFWPGNRIRTIFGEQETGVAGLRSLKDNFKNKIFKDITILSFKNFYPNIICKLSELDIKNTHEDLDPYNEEKWEDNSIYSEKLRWNNDKFPILYRSILDNKSELEKYNNERVNILLRIIINMAYGACVNKYSLFKCSNRNIIAETGRKIVNKVSEKFDDHILFIDTDSIFFSGFDEIEESLEELIYTEIGIPYIIENHLYFLPRDSHSYLLLDNEYIGRGVSEPIKNLKKFNDRREESIEKNQARLKALKERSLFYVDDEDGHHTIDIEDLPTPKRDKLFDNKVLTLFF